MFIGDRFGALETLKLKVYGHDKVAEDVFSIALLHSTGQRIKTLELQGFKGANVIHRMLGFHIEDPQRKIFSKLETLIITRSTVDFAAFGMCLLGGQLPKLIKLDTSDLWPHWSGVNAVTTENWFKLLQERHLQAFPDGKLCITDRGDYDRNHNEFPDYLEKLLVGLSQPLTYPITSSIKSLEMHSSLLQAQECHALAEAISSRNLLQVKRPG